MPSPIKSSFLVLLVLSILCTSISLRVQAATDGPFADVFPSGPSGPSTTDWSTDFFYPQFNPTLGTLTSVAFNVSGSFSTQITVTNSSDSSSSGTAKTEVQLTINDPGGNLVQPSLDLFSPSFGYSLGAGGNAVSGALTQSGSFNNSYTLPVVLGEVTGNGLFFTPAFTFTQTLLSNTGGNTTASQLTSASLSGTVTYTYNPVPEPGTLVLFGIGALGLLAYGRGRRSAR